MLSLLIHERGTPLHLFNSLVVFISILKFLPVYALFKCVLKCFIFFGVITKGIVFLISVSSCVLLVNRNRNAFVFCLLILYPVTLSSSFSICF